MMEILLGFITGIVGSAHCLGMCGPIAIVLPGAESGKKDLVWGRILYNLGRTLTYAFLGALAGLLGFSLSAFGSQQMLSVIMGAMIILFALLPGTVASKWLPFINKTTLPLGMRARFNKNFKKGTPGALLTIGILNGFLPCGLVYFAIAGSIAMGNIFLSILYMVLFGLGTTPAMFAVSMLGNILNVSLRRRFTRIIPLFGIILGVLFILRGLSLGIPFISPTEKKIEKKLKNQKQISVLSNSQPEINLKIKHFWV